MALDLVRFHERRSKSTADPPLVSVGRVRFYLGLLTTILIGGAWITNLFAKPRTTLVGGAVTIVGLGLALLTKRLAQRTGPVVYPHVHSHQHPIVLMSAGRRLPAGGVLVLLPHDPAQAGRFAQLAAAEAPGRPIDFLYIAHEDTARHAIPSMFEILDPYAEDRRAREVFGSAEIARRKLGVEARYIYVPAVAQPGTLDWVVGQLAPAHAMMLDDGAGLAAADKSAMTRHALEGMEVLHYHLQDLLGPAGRDERRGAGGLRLGRPPEPRPYIASKVS